MFGCQFIMYAYGVDISGLRSERLDYTLPWLYTSFIDSGNSGRRVETLFFNLSFEKNKNIPKENVSGQNDPKRWGTVLNIEKKKSTKN